MLASIALIFLTGLLLGWVLKRLHLPPLIGMLLAGILLGPGCLNVLDDALLAISPALRKIALVIILVKAGLSVRLQDLRQVGRPALLMAFVPAVCELLTVTLLGPWLLGLTRLEAAILGSVLAAVSPAVVVPQMVELMEQGWGTQKRVPQLILAGASLDDVVVIVLFTSLTGLTQGQAVSGWQLASIPLSILLGLAAGAGVGLLLCVLMKKWKPNTLHAVLVVLSASFLLVSAEDWLSVPLSGLLAVMAGANVLQLRLPALARQLTGMFSKIWVPAQVLLFVLVGAAVDIRYAAQAGWGVVLLILLALAVRTLGVCLCLVKTPLNLRERLFCMIAYLPKATVQAAIGGVPLAMGLGCGQLILTTAVVAIVLTAPLGAIGMHCTYRRLLEQEP